jgi:osmoprotectant transport system permease protein
MEGLPFFRPEWIGDNLDVIGTRLWEHVQMTIIAVVIGLLLSFALALLIRRIPFLYGPIVGFTGTLYAIPSLALFAILVAFLGLSLAAAEVALVSYTLLILVRNIVAGLRGVPGEVIEAATGMGLTSTQRLLRIELPIALPVIVAGLRIATVTTIGLVTVTALIGRGGLGYLIVNTGINRFFPTSIYTGVVLCVVLAVAADMGLLGLQRWLTPWAHARGAAV